MFTQGQDSTAYKGLADGLVKIYQTEGLRGLYRGMVPALFGTSHGALQFMMYEELKIQRKKAGITDPTIVKLDLFKKGLEYMGMAAISKIFAVVCTYPYQVVKTRLQTERKYLKGNYDGVFSTIKYIFKSEGLAGFYKGMGINIFRVLPGTAIVFGVYEGMTALSLAYGKEN
jgi:solute carrier family 25 folate transporter 32